MRYNAIAFTRPQTRTGNQGYLIPKKVYRGQKGGFLPLLALAPALMGVSGATIASSAIQKQTGSGIRGSGVLDQAEMLYNQSKQGQGLRLAGQGTLYSGAGVGVAGMGLNPAGRGSSYMGMGLSPAGGAIDLAGEGLNPAGGALDLPGGMLRMSLLDSMPKEKKKKRKVIQSVGKDLGSSYAVGPTSTDSMGMGSGKTSLKSMAFSSLAPVLAKTIIPKVLKKLGIEGIVPQSLIDTVVETAAANSNNSVKDILIAVTKKIMPILTHSKLAGMGYHSGGAFKKITKSKKYGKAHGDLAKYLHAKIAGQKGGDFWSDFKDGFLSVIKPFTQIFAPVASAVFPEFSPAIEGVAGLINNA